MGVVFQAQHRDRGIPAAVKILRQRGDIEEPDRLRDEMQVAAGLLHHGILLVYDHGVVSPAAELQSGGLLRAGRTWLAMELASGGTLAAAAPSMVWADVMDMLTTLLDALAHAHAQGVIHRDLKPSNLLLAAPHDLRPGWKLCDFGIAAAAFTDDRTVRGTPRYMAPEQFRADRRPPGPWTDLYAIGCLAWEAVCGAPPFTATEPRQVAMEHQYEPLPPLQPRIAVPEMLEAWLHRLLMKDPYERYRRAADAAWALAGLGPPIAMLELNRTDRHVRRAQDTLDGVELGPPPTPADASHDPFTTLDELIAAPTLDYGADAAGCAMPVAAPPLPETWRRPGAPILPPSLAAAPHLFGLRALPLVGRDRERDRLWEALHAVHDTGAPSAVLVEGERGTGKSALVRWLAERASEVAAADVLRARHARLPGAEDGLSAMFCRFLRVTPTDPDERMTALRKELRRREVRDPAEVAALSALLVLGEDAEPGARIATEERHAMLTRLLRLLAAARPLLLILDDVQWAPDAADWIRWLLDHPSPPLPVMVVATFQPDTAQEASERSTPPWVEALRDRADITRIRTEPLPPVRLGELVQNMLDLHPDLAARVVEAAAGSPLYVTQLFAEWIDRGALTDSPGGLVLKPGVPCDLPADTTAIGERRIDRLLADLPMQARTALEIAAGLGMSVDVDEWREATAAARLPFVRGLVSRLISGGLARPTDRGFRFSHELIRDLIEHRSRREGRWQAVNRAAAMMLEARSDHPGRLGRMGRHLAEADEPARALSALLEAARRRMLKDEARSAEPLLDASARLAERLGLGREDGRVAVLRLLRARAAKARQALDEAWETVLDVEHDAQHHGWPRLEAESLAEQADIARVRGDLPLALRRFRRALVRYEAMEDDHGVADTLRGLSSVALQLGNVNIALVLLERALGRYQEIGDRFGAGMCRAGLGDICRARGAWDDATAHFKASVAELRALGHRSGEAMGLHGLAEVQRLTGDLDAAEAGYQAVIRLDTQLGRDNSLSRLNLALCQIERDAFALAEPTLAELERAWTEQHRAGYLAFVHIAWAVCLAARSDWRGFRARMSHAIPMLETFSLVDRDVARLAGIAGELSMEGGRHEEAMMAWTLALDQWTALGLDDEALATTRRIQMVESDLFATDERELDPDDELDPDEPTGDG
jgi:tetratricopeptide (TPR) repeat protein